MCFCLNRLYEVNMRRSFFPILFAGLMFLDGCSKPATTNADTKASAKTTPVNTTQASLREFEDTIDVTGSIKALKTFDVSSKVAGRVLETMVANGDTVSVGQPIARIDPTDYAIALTSALAVTRQTEAAVKQAEAGVTVAKLRLQQARRSQESQSTSGDVSIRDAEESLAIAGQQLEIAKKPQRTQEIITAESTVAQAEANVTKAVTDKKRFENLVGEGAASQSQLDQVINAEALAKASLRSANAQLDLMRSGGREESVKQAEFGVRRAEQAVRLSKSSNLQNQMRDDDVLAAEASVLQANAALAQATASYQNSASAVAQSKLALRNCNILAPVSGKITRTLAEVGQLVPTGTAVVQILPKNTLVYEALVPEMDVAKLMLGQRVSVFIDGTSQTLPAQITELSPLSESGSRTFRIRCSFAVQPAAALAGMYGKGVILKKTLKGLGLPKDALLKRDESSYFVYVAKDGKSVQVPVKVLFQNTEYVMLTGISVKDVVIVSGQSALSNGTSIRIPAGR